MAEPPFTLGLFGAWGIGKSTILGEVGRRLQGSGMCYVAFDAWRYEGEAFRREFLKDVAAKLGRAGVLDSDFDPREQLRDLYETRATPEEQLTLSRVHALRALMTWGVLAGLLYFLGVLSLSALLAPGAKADPPIVAVLALLPLVFFLLSKTTDVIQVRQHVVTRQRLEEPERFTERFAALLGAVDAERVVISIDNVDRLTADDALLLLSTVKTYLEPIVEHEPSEGCPAVFLVAADDVALRDHLMTRAPRTRASGHYADEYLRKFFNASLTLRPVLDDDIRDYMRKHLAVLAERWGGEEHLDDVVRVCAVGLRHNPRRVKQFVNNLELRLQLISERERATATHASKIEPPISGRLDVVTKLLLIEEEWPEQFAVLRDRPALLREWNELAADRRHSPAWPEGHSNHFSAFLRATSHIDTPNLRAFLRLRRSRVEAALPAYDRFHDAVTTPAGASAAAQLFADVPDETLDRYAERLPDVFEEELKGGNFDAAVAVVTVALTLAPLAARRPARVRLLTYVTREPDILIPVLRAHGVAFVETLHELDAAAQRRVLTLIVGDLVELSEGHEGGRVARAILVDALARGLDLLDEDLLERLRGAIGRRDVSTYVPLYRARADLLPADAGAGLVGRLTVDGRPLLREAGAAWELLEIVIEARQLGPEDETALIEHARAALDQSAPEQLPAALDELRRLLPGVEHAASAAYAALANTLSALMPNLSGAAWDAASELMLDIARMESSLQQRVHNQLAAKWLENVSAASAYVECRDGAVSAEFADALVVPAQQQLMRGDMAPAGLIERLLPERAAALFADAFEGSAKRGQHAAVSKLIARYPVSLAPQAGELAAAAGERLADAKQAPNARDVLQLVALVPVLPERQREQIGAIAADALRRSRTVGLRKQLERLRDAAVAEREAG